MFILLTILVDIHISDGGSGAERIHFRDVHQVFAGPERRVADGALVHIHRLLLTGLWLVIHTEIKHNIRYTPQVASA